MPLDPASDAAPTAPPKSRKRAILISSAAAVAVLAGGAAAWAALFAGGTQPDEVLPGNAVAFVRVDLDPSAGQKVEALKVIDKLPGGSHDDLRKDIWKTIADGDSTLGKIDYDKDIKPWVGNRVGAVLLPTLNKDGDPNTVVAIQADDTTKAEATLKRLTRAHHAGVAVKGDYVLIADTQKVADAAAASKTSLADNVAYKKATGDIEGTVMNGWADLGKTTKLIKDSASSSGTQVPFSQAAKGQIAFAARLHDGTIDVSGHTTGAARGKLPHVTGTVSAANLPRTTTIAVQADGLGQAFAKSWPGLAKQAGPQVTQSAQMLGVHLPEDVVSLLGERLLFAVDGNPDAATPKMAGISVTDDAKRVQGLLNMMMPFLAGPGAQLSSTAEDGKLTLATTKSYLDQVSEGGDLGKQAIFQDVVKNPGAPYVLYVDVAKLAAKDKKNIVKAVGASADLRDGDLNFDVRISTK